MKALLKIVVFVFLLPVMVLAEGVPSVVEINLAIKHHGKRSKLFVDNYELPFHVNSDGKASLLISSQDSINIEIHSYGYQKRVITFFPDRIPLSEEKGIPSSPFHVVDFQNDVFLGKEINEDKFNAKNAYSLYFYWIAGNIQNADTHTGISDVDVGIFYVDYTGINYYTRTKSGRDGSYCIPLNYNYRNPNRQFFIVALKDGFSPSVKLFNKEDYEKPSKTENRNTCYFENLKMNRDAIKSDFISFVPYTVSDNEIETINNFQIINERAEKEIFNISNNSYHFPTEGLLPLNIGIFKNGSGYNRTEITRNDDTLFIDLAVGKDQVLPNENPFSKFIFLPLQYADISSVKLMRRVMEGSADFSGLIVDSESGRVLPNAEIIFNRGERILNSDSRGRFSVEMLLPASYKILINRKGFKTGKFKLNPEKTPYQKFNLDPIPNYNHSAIKGVILSYKNYLAADVLKLSLKGTDFKTITDSQGHFSFENLPEGGYTLIAEAAPNTWRLFYLPPDSTIVDTLVLRNDKVYKGPMGHYNSNQTHGLPGGSLGGYVFDETSNQRIEGVKVSVEGLELSTVTNFAGEYRLWKLPTGYHTIVYQAKGYRATRIRGFYIRQKSAGSKTVRLHTLEDGDETNMVTIEEKPLDPTNFIVFNEYNLANYESEIDGKIYDTVGKMSIANATIRLIETETTTKSDQYGEFTLIEKKRGKFSLEVSAPGFITQTLKLDLINHIHQDWVFLMEPDESYEFQKVDSEEKVNESICIVSYGKIVSSAGNHNASSCKITGQVFSAEYNEPIIGANIVLEGTNRGAATGLDGDFVIVAVEPDQYAIEASSIGFIPARLVIDLNNYQFIECRFYLQPVNNPAERQRGGWCPMN